MNKPNRFQHRALSVAAATIAGLSLSPVSSEAAVVYSGPLNQPVTATPFVFSGLFGNPSIYLVESKGSFITTTFGMVGTSSVSSNLAAGAVIGSSQTFASSLFTSSFNSPTPETWDANQTGFVGFRANDGGENFNYGWIEMSTGANRTNVTILGWAYEDTATASITAGAIPEPSASLLGLSGCAILALRRRRKSN